ncbi:hypothetical protein R3P38DRAFT_2968704 [Favolaschia claudopus]|uniref:Uncharacterized protein n=1 Tax=Favolaschia claudopus TaxID=2862362 RepID=A0AAW0B580_9AGAR
MLRSFDVGADQMASLIEEERIDAAQHCFQQLEQLRRQFDEFQILAHSTQNQNPNVLTIEMQNKEIMSLRRCVEEFQVLERTLFNAGIHYARGHLAGTDPADNRPLFLAPNQVVGSLDDQRRAHYWERTQNAEVVARLDKQLRWGRDVQETKFSQTLAFANDAEGNSNIRSREADSEVVSQRAAKRSRVNTDTPNQPYWDVPQAVAPVSDIAAISRSVSSTPLMTTPLFQLESLSEPCLSPTTSTVAQFVSLYPLLDQWSLPLSKAVVTKSSREFVLPPLASFADAHPCTYYLWFSMRMSLYRRLGGAKPFHGRTAATAAQWEIKLYNTKNGERLPVPVACRLSYLESATWLLVVQMALPYNLPTSNLQPCKLCSPQIWNWHMQSSSSSRPMTYCSEIKPGRRSSGHGG